MSWGPATVFIHRRLRADGQSVGPIRLNRLPSDRDYNDEDDDFDYGNAMTGHQQQTQQTYGGASQQDDDEMDEEDYQDIDEENDDMEDIDVQQLPPPPPTLDSPVITKRK
jgi:hypothetical protein